MNRILKKQLYIYIGNVLNSGVSDYNDVAVERYHNYDQSEANADLGSEVDSDLNSEDERSEDD